MATQPGSDGAHIMDLSGYVDVAQRLQIAAGRFPELRIQELETDTIEVDGHRYIRVKVSVWRTPDDPLPVIAECWEPFPGKTPYTRDSEQANASTSAVGRALRLLLPDVGGPVASAEEVRNRSGEGSDGEAGPPRRSPRSVPNSPTGADRPQASADKPASDKQRNYAKALMRSRGMADWSPPDDWTAADASSLIEELKAEVSE